MVFTLDDKLVLGISSRALFDLAEADAIYQRDGLAAYRAYQRAHEPEPLAPGTGFPLVRALLKVNGLAKQRLVEVILMSRNDADSSVRIFSSAESHGLDVTRGALTGGSDPWPYLQPFHASLFLSSESADVVAALARGFPAALVLAPPPPMGGPVPDPEIVRIAFDGDAVLFDDKSERIYRENGIEAFIQHEVDHQDEPMDPGPFRPFFVALKRIQEAFEPGQAPIRTALVTSRNAPAHKRVVNTFRAWGIHTDEAFFLGGIDKAGVLETLRPHIFFDDQMSHLVAASSAIPAAHVIPTYEQRALFPEEEVPVVKPEAPGRPARARKATSSVSGSTPIGRTQKRRRPSARAPFPLESSTQPASPPATGEGRVPAAEVVEVQGGATDS